MGEISKHETGPHLRSCVGPSRRAYEILIDTTVESGTTQKRFVICSGAPSPECFDYLISSSDPGTRILLYSVAELHAMSAYSLRAIQDVSAAVGDTVLADLLGAGCVPEPDRDLRLLELCRKIANAIGPIDNTLLSKRDVGGPERLRLRALKYKECLEECTALGLGIDTAGKLPPGSFEGTWDELRAMKILFLDLLKDLPPLWKESTSVSASLDQSDRVKFGYLQGIAGLFGKNLSAVCAYGSSVSRQSRDAFKDFDNWVIVRDLPEAYRQAGQRELSYDGHPVHLMLLPEEVVTQYLFCEMSPLVNAGSIKVLHGTLNLPCVSDEEIVRRGAVVGLHMLFQRRSTALGAILDSPSFIVDTYRSSPKDQKRDLFNNICQAPLRFLIGAAAAAQDGAKARMSKAETDSVLETNGIRLPRFPEGSPDEALEDAVKKELRSAVIESARLFELLWRNDKGLRLPSR